MSDYVAQCFNEFSSYYQPSGTGEALHASIDLHGMSAKKHKVFSIIAARPKPRPRPPDEGISDA